MNTGTNHRAHNRTDCSAFQRQPAAWWYWHGATWEPLQLSCGTLQLSTLPRATCSVYNAELAGKGISQQGSYKAWRHPSAKLLYCCGCMLKGAAWEDGSAMRGLRMREVKTPAAGCAKSLALQQPNAMQARDLYACVPSICPCGRFASRACSEHVLVSTGVLPSNLLTSAAAAV